MRVEADLVDGVAGAADAAARGLAATLPQPSESQAWFNGILKWRKFE